VHCNVDVDEDVFGDVHEDGHVFKYEVVYEDEDVSSGHHGDSVCLSVCLSVSHDDCDSLWRHANYLIVTVQSSEVKCSVLECREVLYSAASTLYRACTL
jgi:hypothetical protein